VESQRLTEEVYGKYPDGVTLTSEYAELVQDNLLHVLIRRARCKFVTKMLTKTDNVLEVGSGSERSIFFEPSILSFLGSLGQNEIDLSKEVLPEYIGRIVTFLYDDYHRDCSGPIAMDTLMGGLSTCRGEIDETEAQEV
jgi:hypothetical protein